MRATQARAVLDLIAGAGLPDDSAYGSFIKMYAQFLGGKLEDARPRQDALLLHDELEEVNDPVYFHQFAEQAARHGLQYLGDAEFHTMAGGRESRRRETADAIGKLARSVVDAEQYMDFLSNRTFRQTLLCHEAVALNRTLRPDRVEEPVRGLASPPAGRARILDARVILSVCRPVSRHRWRHLVDRPPCQQGSDPLSGRGLASSRAFWRIDVGSPCPSGTRSRSERDECPTLPELDAQVLGANLLTAYSYSDKLVELHAYAPPVAREVGDRPAASHVARFQASHHNDRVTNLRHERVSLDEADRYLLGSPGRQHTTVERSSICSWRGR